MEILNGLSVGEYSRALALDAWRASGGDLASFEKAYEGVNDDASDGGKRPGSGADSAGDNRRALRQSSSAGEARLPATPARVS